MRRPFVVDLLRLTVLIGALAGLPAMAREGALKPPPGWGETPRLPPSLNIVDWAQIQDEYQRHRHAFFPATERGRPVHLARAWEQQWLATFDGRGFTVKPEDGGFEWGLELASYGRAGRQTAVKAGHPTANVNHFSYHYGPALTEWYVNDTRGLEHGFTLRERTAASGTGAAEPVVLTLAVRGGLRPRLIHDGVEFVDEPGAPRMRYSALTVTDAMGRRLPAHFAVFPASVRIAIDDSAAHYPLTIDPLVQQAYLKASNTGADDNFGAYVAASGDTVVVSAPGEDSSTAGVNGTPNQGAADSGAAYVFVRSGTTWTQQAFLKASNPGVEDLFGWSVAASGDTVVVGAPSEDSSTTGSNSMPNDGASASGAVYVFVRSGTTWTQQAFLKASNTAADDFFGASVAASGDTVVVGAPAEDSSTAGVNSTPNETATNSGAAYVFVRSGTTWTQQAYLKASNPGAGDGFGVSVGANGDTAIVGSAYEDSSSTGVNSTPNDASINSGAAYVFVRNGTTWAQQAFLKASNTDAGDYFGSAVAASGDTVVVTAPIEDSSTTGVNSTPNEGASIAGAAYVFVRSGTTWTQQAFLKASNTGTGDYFGGSVALSEDTLVVGALFENSSTTGINSTPNDTAPTAGAAYVFTRTGITWTQQAYLKASNTGADDQFGTSVAAGGDTVVIGALLEDSATTGVNSTPNEGATDAGAVYVFASNTVNLTIASTPANLLFTASGPGCTGGSNLTTPAVLTGTPGQPCTLSFGTPQDGPTGTRYGFSQWENGTTDAARTFTVPAVSTTYTATFTTRYRLTMNAIPAGDGTVTASPASTDGFYTAGAVVQLSAAPAAGRQFAGWSGALSGTANPQSVTMSAARDVTAAFSGGTGSTASGLRFVPLSPCRVMETRAAANFEGRTGAFGPPALAAAETRTLVFPASTICSIPSHAKAYVVNVTLIPNGGVDFVTVWPAGEPRPNVWTIRSPDGQIVANSSIVKAGANGGISVYASNATDLLIDISGYYTDNTAVTGLAYYPLTPCRVIDTRLQYRSPAGPFGPPTLLADQTRRFRFPATPYCTVPGASAYSVTVTVVPPAPLAYLTAWPAGIQRPNVSSINSFAGRVLANSVIIPASADGSLDVYAFNATDLLIDINGYYAPDNGSGLFYYPITQCRASDSTVSGGIYADETTRTLQIPAAAGCSGIPANAKGYAINVTALPNGNPMPFLTAYPTGEPRPGASILNAFEGQIVTNAAIIPAGANGAIDIFAFRRTNVVVEVSGYFGR